MQEADGGLQEGVPYAQQNTTFHTLRIRIAPKPAGVPYLDESHICRESLTSFLPALDRFTCCSLLYQSGLL